MAGRKRGKWSEKEDVSSGKAVRNDNLLGPSCRNLIQSIIGPPVFPFRHQYPKFMSVASAPESSISLTHARVATALNCVYAVY